MQPLSHFARVADAATQPFCHSRWLSHSARVADAANQPLSHSATVAGRVAGAATQPLCQSGWVADVKISAIARSILKTPTTNKLRRCRKTSSPKKTWWFSKRPIIKIDNHRHEKKSTDQKMVSIAQCPSPFCRESSTGSVWVEKLPNTPWAYPTLNVGWHDNPNSFTPRKNSVTKGKARWWIRNVWVARYSSKPRVDLQARFKLNELFDEGGCVWVGSTSLDVWGPGSHIVQEEDCRTACQESHPKLRGKEDW